MSERKDFWRSAAVSKTSRSRLQFPRESTCSRASRKNPVLRLVLRAHSRAPLQSERGCVEDQPLQVTTLQDRAHWFRKLKRSITGFKMSGFAKSGLAAHHPISGPVDQLWGGN